MMVLTALLAMLGFAPLARDDEGQTMAEYGLILAGIAAIVLVTVWALGSAINETFESILDGFDGPPE